MRLISRQRGVVLMLVLLSMLMVGGTVFLIAIGNSANQQSRTTPETLEKLDVLKNARDALLGYSIALNAGGSRPGQMPRPDHANDGNYDGNADDVCMTSADLTGATILSGAGMSVTNLRCVGRLPWNTLSVQLPDTSAQDSTGVVPWYVVSQNLADFSFCMKVLNPTTAAGAVTTFAGCPVTAGPAWPWIKVCDASGKVISDRVAIVLIAPGVPIQTEGRMQARPAISADPRNFMDAVPTPTGWASLPAASRCNTFDNGNLSNEFIMADVSVSFNDRLTYITIDELMESVERRVATDAREAMITYKTLVGTYPWLAPLVNPAAQTQANTSTPAAFAVNSNLALAGTMSGLLPFQSNNQEMRFMTELTWNVVTSTADTTNPTGTLSTTQSSFSCYAGTYTCRIRLTGSISAIPRTITATEFTALRTASIATPSVACRYSQNSAINCEPFVYSTQIVSYVVQRRASSLLPWTTLPGSYSGTRTRRITIAPISATPTFTPDSSAILARRRLSAAVNVALDVTDRWVPTTAGVAPFDLLTGAIDTDAGSKRTGTMATSGLSTATVSQIRVSPVLPDWYFSERWYEFMYAAISPDSAPSAAGVSANCSANCLAAGARTGFDVIVLSAGKAIGTQSRTPTPTISDFLEAPNATGASTRMFADVSKKRDSTYADTVATIPR